MITNKDIVEILQLLEHDMRWYFGGGYLIGRDLVFVIRERNIDLYEGDVLLASYFCELSLVERYFDTIHRINIDREICDDINTLIDVLNLLDDETFASYNSNFVRARR